ncbi:hypothetical protein UA08_07072 [Talaromyces atroroseus]|uniref:ATP-grasp domain-containing protein n=1 Tax=Talaromyces atroroseus TaxID=1441469 RepID=A0A225AK74_TALAT|nr:hypothetical protein UA08_07072 [Talaromyces atroroseus]OKL57608.1 hypothetical protein UA08_07072 [Talaromyces atroroseus]
MAPRPSYRPAILKPESGGIYTSTNLTIPGILRLIIGFLVSLLLLPLNTSVLLSTALLNRFHALRSPEQLNRQQLLQNPHFYPKTILITGVSTVRGLKLARQFHYGGHRVIGADVGLLPVRPGGSMSNTIFAYYSVSKAQYICNLIDIINREKVDLWIPYSDFVTPVEDGMAKSTIESRTACRCFHVNMNYVTLFDQTDSFLKHVSERGLPTAAKQKVHSRDSLHRILNGSPNKAYLVYNPSKGTVQDAVSLPKSTRSQTYSDVSVLEISKDNPWILHQRGRLGKYWVDLVLVRGYVRAIQVHPLHSQPSEKGDSIVENGLHETMKRLMDSFAEKVGPRISGHLSIQLMVDKEIATNSVCYAIYICGCRQGSAATSGLLDDPPPDLFNIYLEILSPEVNGIPSTPEGVPFGESGKNHAAAWEQPRASSSWVAEITKRLAGQIEQLQHAIAPLVHFSQRAHGFELLDRTGFSILDPLPWWWHYHISQPLNSLVSLFDGEVEMPVKSHSWNAHIHGFSTANRTQR